METRVDHCRRPISKYSRFNADHTDTITQELIFGGLDLNLQEIPLSHHGDQCGVEKTCQGFGSILETMELKDGGKVEGVANIYGGTVCITLKTNRKLNKYDPSSSRSYLPGRYTRGRKFKIGGSTSDTTLYGFSDNPFSKNSYVKLCPQN